MRPIKEEDFKDYTIKGNGWTITLNDMKKALGEWKTLQGSGLVLYGNKHDGTQAILDTKQ